MKKSPNEFDVYVGSRVRMARTLIGMSQEKLGFALGITFQQIQKYEKGSNRIGSSRLVAISRALNKPIAWFFEGIEQEQAADNHIEQMFQSAAGGRLLRTFASANSIEQKLIADLASTIVKAPTADTASTN
ncbi:helix-turn-helix domain-containing protein [Cohaesibacter celericrescens]|uniref:helix-turn-helix domain-containing protein n=1 Tax=Cohaesibacter celericrescens TaxID=2067669 RepID=UPI003564C47E